MRHLHAARGTEVCAQLPDGSEVRVGFPKGCADVDEAVAKALLALPAVSPGSHAKEPS